MPIDCRLLLSNSTHYNRRLLPKKRVLILFCRSQFKVFRASQHKTRPARLAGPTPIGFVMGAAAYKLVGLIDGKPESSVYSSLEGPIESLSMLRRSLLFAELANLSYLSRTEAGMMVHRIGFPEIRYYDREGAQAYILAN